MIETVQKSVYERPRVSVVRLVHFMISSAIDLPPSLPILFQLFHLTLMRVKQRKSLINNKNDSVCYSRSRLSMVNLVHFAIPYPIDLPPLGQILF